MDPDQRLAELVADRSSGASEITRRALELFHEVVPGADDPIDVSLTLGSRLIQAHPAMAPLVNLVDQVLEALETQGPGGLAGVAEAARARDQAVVDAVSRRLAGLGTVATYSRSSTVLRALSALETPPRVLISEARPGQEGTGVARELAQAGAQVTLTIDAALPHLLGHADLLVVGADSLCQAGVVNKTGTHPLARQAQTIGCPVVVAAATDKQLPSTYRRAPPSTPQAHLEGGLPEGVTTEIPLFEVTPWELVDEVVTEAGPRSPREVQTAIDRAKLHDLLLDRLAGQEVG